MENNNNENTTELENNKSVEKVDTQATEKKMRGKLIKHFKQKKTTTMQ